MANPWLVGGALGAGMLSDFLGGSASQRQNQRNFENALEAYRKALKKGKRLYQKEREHLQEGMGLADEEFKRATGALASQSRRYSSEFRRAEKGRQGDVKQALQRSGGGATMYRYLQQQSAGDTAREGRRSFADLAGKRAGVEMGRAGQKLGLQRQLAHSYSQQAQFGMQGAQGLTGIYGNAQASHQSSPFGGIAAFLQGLNTGGTDSPAQPANPSQTSWPRRWR